jgi:predicted nucleotidyltransferase
MKYGFSDEQLEEIIAFIGKYDEVERAVLFGSRAIGTYKEASDVDIAIFGERATAGLAAKMKFDIEEDTYLPFLFDFVAYSKITNEALKEHIDDKGVELYKNKLIAVADVTGTDLMAIEMIVPGVYEQQAITSVLSSLDGKIDLLRRQNVTLEAMAEAIFRQWFVVEAKEEWGECAVGEIIELNYGKGLNGTARSGNGFPVTGSSGIVGYHDSYLVLPITIQNAPLQLIIDYEQLAGILFKKISNNQAQTRTLEKLRDTLLPKLMSGEVKFTWPKFREAAL